MDEPCQTQGPIGSVPDEEVWVPEAPAPTDCHISSEGLGIDVYVMGGVDAVPAPSIDWLDEYLHEAAMSYALCAPVVPPYARSSSLDIGGSDEPSDDAFCHYCGHVWCASKGGLVDLSAARLCSVCGKVQRSGVLCPTCRAVVCSSCIDDMLDDDDDIDDNPVWCKAREALRRARA